LNDGPILGTRPITFVTIDGAIGVIQTIPESRFDYLYEIQRNIADTFTLYSRRDFEAWHHFSPSYRTHIPNPFIDGNVLKSFVTMSPSEKLAVRTGKTIINDTDRDIERQIVDLII
jgi:hypothetical protein